MNRRGFLQAALASAPAFAAPAMGEAVQGDLNESRRRIRRATEAAMAMQRRDWEQGILAQAMLEAGDRERVILLTKAAIVSNLSVARRISRSPVHSAAFA
jgi:type II secretory pathway component HofQ